MSSHERAVSITTDEISVLTTALNDQLERLEFLTAGEVDTLMDAHGRTFLLRHAQNELRQREAMRQAAILDALPAQIALLNGEGGIVSTNQSWRDQVVVGEAHRPGHAIGSNYLALCEHASGDGVDASRQLGAGLRAVMEGRSQEFSLEYAGHAGGGERWYLVTATPLPDQSAHGAVVMHSDITHRKLAQAALDELSRTTSRTERILSTTLGAIVDFAYIFDRDGRFLFANRALSDLLGLDEGALVGKDFLELGYPVDLAEKLQRQVEHVFTSGCALTDVTPFVSDAGADGLYEYIFSPVLAADGTVEYVAGCTRDITQHHLTQTQNSMLISALQEKTVQLEDANLAIANELDARRATEASLQESRDRLKLATKSVGIGIWDWDVKANRMHWDSRMFELYGVREQDFSSAVDAWEAALHPEDMAQAQADLAAALDGAGDFQSEFRVLWPSGAVRYIQAHALVQRAADGTAVRMTGVNFDVSERRLGEEESRHAEQTKERALRRLTDAQRVGQIGDFEVDIATGAVSWSPQTFEILGRDPSLGPPTHYEESLASHYEPASRIVIAEMIAAVIASGEPRTYEVVALHRDGKRVAVEGTTVPRKDADGRVVGLYGTMQDVSARKRAERLMRESEERLDFALQAAAVGDWDVDLRTNETRRSLRHDQCFGYAEMLPAWSYDRFLAHIQVQDRDRVDAGFQKAMAGGGDYDEEFRVRWPDGSEHWLWHKGRFYFDEAGQPLRVAGIVTEISDRKLAEAQRKRGEIALREAERFSRATLDSLTKSLCVLDESGSIIWVNKAWQDFAATRGGVPAGVCEGTNYLAVCDAAAGDDDHEAAAFAAAIRGILAGQRADFAMEYPCHSEGEEAWFLGRVSRFKDEGQKRIVVSHEDITQRKQAEFGLLKLNDELEEIVGARTQALELARHEAEAASKSKSEFLAAMSHEIRTPMNGVIGMIEVLQQSSLRGDQVEMATLIRESAFSLLGIINDILDFSKIEAGKLELEREPFAIEGVADGVVGLLDDMAQKKDVVLTLFVDPEIPVQVVGDALRLRQVLTNLLNNAIKFCSGQPRPGRVSMRLRLVERSPQQVMVELQVTDNGIGMSEDIRARLFTEFSQADASTTRRFGGSGLGLAIVHHLVTLMGGSVTVESTVGQGASFTVLLPFEPLPAQANDGLPPSEVAGLSCVVVGNAGAMADDLASYLAHAQAHVQRQPDLEGARQWQAGRDDLSVWIVDAGDDYTPPGQTQIAGQDDPDAHVVVVFVERGNRRRPRVVGPNALMVDGNALSRRTFLRTVAVAAGRASLEIEAMVPDSGRSAPIGPSRENALRAQRLILIAEDNETNQKVIVRQLALLGYAADIAADGHEALDLWRSGDYALLITDLHMPKMDGYDLTRAIRAQEAEDAHMPIIALTANALKGEDQRCRATGMDDYRSKPATLVQLREVLERWLPAAGGAEDSVAPDAGAAATRPGTTAAPLDVDVLRALVGDDPEVVDEFLDGFRASAVVLAEDVRAACAAGQPVVAADAAHKLKSSARAVGAIALAEACAAIEDQGRLGKGEALAMLLLRFDADMAAVNDCLDKHASDSRQTAAEFSGSHPT